LVGIVSADLNSTRVIVDTASDSDCKNDSRLFLGDYVSRSERLPESPVRTFVLLIIQVVLIKILLTHYNEQK
jgi:hypothetical protein